MESPLWSSEHNLFFRNEIEFEKQYQDLNYHFLVVAGSIVMNRAQVIIVMRTAVK